MNFDERISVFDDDWWILMNDYWKSFFFIMLKWWKKPHTDFNDEFWWKKKCGYVKICTSLTEDLQKSLHGLRKKFIYLQHSISRLSGRMKTQTKCKLRWRWFFLTFPISVSGVITNMTSGIAPVLRNRISSITRTLIYMGIIKGQRKKGGRSDYQSQGLLAGSTLKSSSVSYTTETEESKSQQWFESPFDNWYT